jgi:hypothetical protein
MCNLLFVSTFFRQALQMSFLLTILAVTLYYMKHPLSLSASYIRNTRRLLIAFSLIIWLHPRAHAQWADALTNDATRGALYRSGGSLKAGMAAADLDGDGKPELIAANFNGNSISVFRNTGSTNIISIAAGVDYTTGASPQAIAIGDLNADGKPEVVVANALDDNISVLFNSSTAGNISLSLAGNFPAALGASSVVIKDIDADGLPDIVCGSNRSAWFCVLKNTTTAGSISFAAKTDFAIGSSPVNIVVTDMDGDGKPDVAASQQTANTISYMRNTTSGTISFASTAALATGTAPVSLCAADLDGDHKPELAVINSGSATLSVFPNTSTAGAISFGAKTDYAVGANPSGVVVTDTDIDGYPDIAVGYSFAYSLTVFMNTGGSSGAIGLTPYAYTASTHSENILAADMDADGKGDLVLTERNSSYISAVRNIFKEPYITSFTPSSGLAGTTVTITGVYLNGATAVKFGSTAAASYTVNSATEITATPATGATGQVTVTTPYGTGISQNTFTYLYPPTISSFTPTSGYSGSTVTIFGNYFTGATGVRLGGVAATAFTVVSPTRINATVGAGTSGSVSVTTPVGTATLGGFTHVGPAIIYSFSPTSAKTGDVVTINGVNFKNISIVTLGGVAAAGFTTLSPTTITATVGAGASGSVEVYASSGQASRAGFTYIPPPPVINSFAAVTGIKGSAITITGANFTGATAVGFGGVPAASFTINSATGITAIVDNGASGDVSVTTPGGTATLGGFTFIPPPVITGCTPLAAIAGQTITITGNNFNNAGAVSFGGTAAASFTVVSTTTITAIAGGGASGDVSVTTPGGTALLGGFSFIHAPAITSFTPTAAGAGQTVTITGSDFNAAGAVNFGGTAAASFTVVSPTTITAVIGTGASGDVSVTTPGGTASMGGFTFTPPVPVIPVPVIILFSPDTATARQVVTITGNNFTGATTVSFGGTAAASFTVVSPTTITAVAGEGSSGLVSVTTPGGNAILSGFIYAIVPVPRPLPTGLTVYPNPARNKTWLSHPVSTRTTYLTVTDIKGNILKHVSVNAGEHLTRINITGLAAGCYQITWRDGERVLTKSLIIQ